jgi:hypothetical protein
MQDAAVRKRLSRARADIRDELLQRLGEFARSSAPGAAFTAIVMGSLTLASPPAAAATVLLGTGGAIAGKGLLKLLLGSLGSIGFGIAGGLSGVWWGLRKYLKAPFDAVEYRSLLRYGISMSALVIAFSIGIVLSTASRGWLAPTAVTLAYVVGIMAMTTAWMPRILARRRAQEALDDPVAAAATRRKEKRWSRIGCTVGLTLGLGALVFGLFATGRL